MPRGFKALSKVAQVRLEADSGCWLVLRALRTSHSREEKERGGRKEIEMEQSSLSTYRRPGAVKGEDKSSPHQHTRPALRASRAQWTPQKNHLLRRSF